MPASKKKSADAGDAELPPSVLVELERRVNQVEAIETSYILYPMLLSWFNHS
jgi:hypothetical protein